MFLEPQILFELKITKKNMSSFKEQGNEQFKAKNFEKAIEFFSQAIA